jgi:SH3-like domain-containing protein|tara:strand:+ start:190 stop:642 length:453 start_codon:yes stop_codon:yes gene_type:complete
MRMVKVIALFFLFFFISINFLSSEEYFSTLKYNKVNLRQGPSKDYPVKIFYKKKYLPVLVFDSSDNYRKIRDHENNTGWIHVSQLSRKKAALVNNDQIIMFKNSTIFSKPIAILEKGRLCVILKCNDAWCKIKTDKYSGWVKKESLWGNF